MVITIPRSIPITGPPMTGNIFPNIQLGTDIIRLSTIPFHVLFRNSIILPPLNYFHYTSISDISLYVLYIYY